MTRLFLASGLVLWLGTTLIFSRLRWFSRVSLAERLLPYRPRRGGHRSASARHGHDSTTQKLSSAESFKEVIAPLAGAVGNGLSRLLGIGDELARKLDRVHSPIGPTEFRVRQLGWVATGLAGGIGLTVASGLGPMTDLLFTLGMPLLAFLVTEESLSRRSKAWQERIFLELPVMAEQMAMLISAGYSVGAGLSRVASRGQGACAEDLSRVCARIHQGMPEDQALAEWAAVAQVPALDRVVAVLNLGPGAADLARLVSEEARSIRRDAHRRLLETMERRLQQVWVPVTVAALVPGVIFLSIPFVSALRMFAGG
ncbi:MAG: type II secretion system F family protein [Acidimicrobiales bacterium]